MGGRREGMGGEMEGSEKGREGEGGDLLQGLGGDRRPCRTVAANRKTMPLQSSGRYARTEGELR